MQNTWSIGRTWKPREGWSRPVLTDERQHSFPDLFGERIILLQTIPYGNEHGMNTRRNINSIRVRCPVPRPPQGRQTLVSGRIREDLRRSWPR